MVPAMMGWRCCRPSGRASPDPRVFSVNGVSALAGVLSLCVYIGHAMLRSPRMRTSPCASPHHCRRPPPACPRRDRSPCRHPRLWRRRSRPTHRRRNLLPKCRRSAIPRLRHRRSKLRRCRAGNASAAWTGCAGGVCAIHRARLNCAGQQTMHCAPSSHSRHACLNASAPAVTRPALMAWEAFHSRPG